ncbi:hypothetical protein [Vibrio algicola]|uniref:hypothetical protein n=1 Tax=Vibrio algicola TaxID=2662262 RepID=UPI0015B4D13D|nr:hypothetical protein [Vibrio algicola]
MKNPSLQNTSMFKNQKLIANLPEKVFVIALFIAACGAALFFKLCGFSIGLILSLIFIYIVYKPLYIIHTNDLDAWRLYIKATYSATYFDASYTTPKHILVVRRDKLIHLKDLDL